MHLEKVTTRSSEAGLAGWIASNDVTLFTMVLIMVIAIFLHTKLNKGAREQQTLAEENVAIAASLDETARELDSARDLLDQTSVTLELTQSERDQLQKQLVDKLAAMAELSAKLDALLAEKGVLETQRQTLLAEAASLTQQAEALAGERSALSASNLTLRERLDSLTALLEAKIAALADVEEQRDRLKMQADELDGIVAALQQRLRELNVELVAARDQAAADLTASQKTVDQLRADAASRDRQAEDYLEQLKRAAALLQSLETRNQQLTSDITEAERLHQAQLLAEAENNRALVGLRGPMRRVAMVFDASGSMRQATADGGDRWAEAQEIAATWVRHLNVQQCVLIVFSSSVRTFPANGSLVDLRGAAGQVQREVLLKDLHSVSPGGWTNTYEALRTAYQYDVDTILLLSDGAPSRVPSGAYDEALAQQIYQLCRQHRGIPVNTIGLGNYFDKDMSSFLRTVASLTGGAFRGE